MSIRVSCRNVRLVELQRRVHEVSLDGSGLAHFLEQVGNGVAPGFGSSAIEHRLDRFLGSLLGRETRPVVEAVFKIVARVGEVPLRLCEPVRAALH